MDDFSFRKGRSYGALIVDLERHQPIEMLPDKTAATFAAWLKAHPHDNVRFVRVGALEPRTFSYLQDPGHGWLIVSRDDLIDAGMSPSDFSSCSYVKEDSLALEEDCDMPRFLKRLDERGIPYRLREQHTKGDAYVRRWASNPISSATPE